MGYVGRGLNQEGGQYRKLDDISSGFNGSETSFSLTVSNLAVTPTAQNLLISISGVIQEPGSAFSMNGSTITFTEAPAGAASFFGVVMGEASYIAYDTVGANELGVTAGTVKASRGVVVDTSSNVSGFNRITGTSGSFNYITASVIDTDASTIRVGGSPISKTLVDNLTTMTGSGTVQGTGTTDTTTFSGGTYTGDLGVSGSMTVKGTLTAQEFKTEFVSASIIYDSGSSKFGDTADDIHQMTGSLRITGSGDHYIQTGKVGIGTTSPGSSLHIGDNNSNDGTDITNGLTISNQGGGDAILQFSIPGVARWKMGVDNSDSDKLKIAGLSSPDFGSNTRMTIDSSGNVGIGTNSPATKIDVGSTSDGSGVIASFRGDGFTTRLDHTSNVAHLYTGGASNSLTFGTNSTERMRIDNSGNVGIGETNPAVPLHITGGNLRLDHTRPMIQFEETDGTADQNWQLDVAAGVFRFQANNDAFSSADTKVVIDQSGRVGIGTTSPNEELEVHGATAAIKIRATGTNAGDNPSINFQSTEATGVAARAEILADDDGASTKGALIFKTRISDNLTEAMRIDSSGRVGIGTASPSKLLHLNAIDASPELRITSGSAVAQMAFSNGNGYFLRLGDASNNEDVMIRSYGDTIFNGGGDVGIGTTSPAPFKLKVSEGSSFMGWYENNSDSELKLVAGGTNTNQAGIYFGDVGDNVHAGVRYDTSNQKLQLQAYNNTTAVTIDSSERVGIGVTAPEQLLHVRGDTTNYVNLHTGIVIDTDTITGNKHGLVLNSSGDALQGMISSNLTYNNGTASQGNVNRSSGYINIANTTTASKTSSFEIGGTVKGSTTLVPLVNIDNDGNVGIGTTNPSAILHLSNGIGQDSTILAFGDGSDKTYYIDANYAGGGQNGNWLQLNDYWGNIITTWRNGSFGIGTTSPNYLLDVEGNVASDYVARFFNDGNSANRYGIRIDAGADDGSGTTDYITCQRGDGTQIGYIRNTSGVFALTDVSDRRLKENIRDTEVKGLDAVSLMKVRDFEWKDSGDTCIGGFIAQELKSAFAPAVSGEDGDLEEDGRIKPMGVSRDMLVPVLVKALQEADDKIDALTARIEALES